MTVADRRYLIALTAAGLCVAAVFVAHLFMPVDAVFDLTGHPIGRDFLNVWGAPRVAAEHGAAALGDLALYRTYLAEAFGHAIEHPFNWSYPPHALLLLEPFSAPSYPVALALWTMAGLAAFAAAVAAGLRREDRTFGVALAVLSPAGTWCVMTGQNGLLIGAGLLAALLSLDRRPILAGVLFGLLTVKPQLGLLVPVALVAMGAWRTIAAATVTSLLLGAVALALYGIEPWTLWLTTTAEYQLGLVENIADPVRHMQSFHHFVMASIAASGHVAGLPHGLVWGFQAVGAAVAAAAVWTTFRRGANPSTRALVLLLSSALATPYVFNYDLTALSGAALWAMAGRGGAGAKERFMLGLVFLLPAALPPLHLVGLPVAPLLCAAALAMAVRRVLAAGRAETPSSAAVFAQAR